MSLIGSSSAHKLFLMLLLPLFFVHQTSSSPVSCRAWNNTHELYEDLKRLGTFLNVRRLTEQRVTTGTHQSLTRAVWRRADMMSRTRAHFGPKESCSSSHVSYNQTDDLQLCSSNSDGSNPDCRDLRLNKTSQEASSSPDYFIKGLEQLMSRVSGTSTDLSKIIEPLTDSCKCPDVDRYICSKTFLLPSVISPVAFYEVLNTRVQQYNSRSMQTPSSTD